MTWLTCRQLEGSSGRTSGSDGAGSKSLLWVLLRCLFKYFVCNRAASCGFRERSRRLVVLNTACCCGGAVTNGAGSGFLLFFRSLRRSGWVS